MHGEGLRLTRMSGILLFHALLLLGPAPGTAFAQSGSFPLCTTEQVAHWEGVRAFSEGVEAWDPVGHEIQHFAAYKFFIEFPRLGFEVGFIKNWHPVSGYKDTLCGEVFEFDTFHIELPGFTDENDINVYIIPNPFYKYIVEQVMPLEEFVPPGLGWHQCRTEYDCAECEITPDSGFYDNRWFNMSRKSFVRAGKTACVYGPWVYEKVHGNRPEIHPTEMIWWREADDPGSYVLIHMQDDSNRYDRPENFSVSEIPSSADPPPGWRPWAKFPLTGEFRIAFGSASTDDPIVFTVESTRSIKVLPAQDNRERHTLRPPGPRQPPPMFGRLGPVTVIEDNRGGTDKLDVSFCDVCRRADGFLQGFVKLRSRIGDDDRGGHFGEGVHGITVRGERARTTAKQVLVRFRSARASYGSALGERATITRIAINGQSKDLCIDLPPDQDVELPKSAFLQTILDGEPLVVQGTVQMAPGVVRILSPSRRFGRVQNYGAGRQTLSSPDGAIVFEVEIRSVSRNPSEVVAGVGTPEPSPFMTNMAIDSDREPTRGSATAVLAILEAQAKAEGRRAIARLTVQLTGLRRERDGDTHALMASLTMTGRADVESTTRLNVGSRQRMMVRSPGGEAFELDAIALAVPRINADVTRSAPLPSPSAKRLLRSLGVLTPMPSGVRMEQALEMTLRARPVFGPMKGGDIMVEEKSLVADRMNAAIKKNRAGELVEIFGSAQPFEPRWRLAARAAGSSKSLPIQREGKEATKKKSLRRGGKVERRKKKEGQSNPGIIQFSGPSARSLAPAATVTFPADLSMVAEVDVIVNVTDTNGFVGEGTSRVWSHFIAADTQQLLVAYGVAIGAEAAGVSTKTLVASAAVTGRGPTVTSETRRARIVKTVAAQFAEDDRLTAGEIGKLRAIGSAKDNSSRSTLPQMKIVPR